MISQQENNVPTRNGLQSSPATSNAIRGAEQSGNIAKQRFARIRWVRGLAQQYGRHDKQVVGITASAQQKSEQLASKDRSDFEGMVIFPEIPQGRRTSP